MSAPDVVPLRRARASAADGGAYGTIAIVGGGCYGSYYVRQLERARRAGVIEWQRLLVVDRDAACRVASERTERCSENSVSGWA